MSRSSQSRLSASRHRGRRGFTLVEVLVSIGILAMVLAAIYSSWTAILRASKVGQDAAAAVQRARMAYRSIEEALSCSVSFEGSTNYLFLAENGSEASLSFVARLPDSFPRSGRWPGLNVRRVQFSLEPGPDSSGQLVLRQRPLLEETTGDFDETEMKMPLVLAKYVSEFAIEFRDQRGEWVEEWKQLDQLPRLVRFTLKLADNPNARTARRPEEEVVRIVSLPSFTVLRRWQPQLTPGPGQPLPGQGIPGQPVPGQLPPGQMQPGQFPPGQYQPGRFPGSVPGQNIPPGGGFRPGGL